MKKSVSILLVLLLVLSLPFSALAVEGEGVEVLTEALDYGSRENWAYFALGEGKAADVFLICPTVDTRSYANALDLNEKLKGRFIAALAAEKGIYADMGRLYSPYYRQMSIGAMSLPEAERAQAEKNAYLDVSAAFRWYLDHENNGRPLILAGFSQGSQMCIELLKEYYGTGEEAQALREGLIAVYAIGWAVTEEDTAAWPQIVPAKGETDVGAVVSFDCEDGSVTGTVVLPAGEKALSINPLNWRTDAAPADKSLNLGAVLSLEEEPVPGLCGAYLGERGELVVTGVSAEEYPPKLEIFPTGSFHVYDCQFFFTNLRQNVADRTSAFLSGTPFKDVKPDAWYASAVKYAFDKGLINGVSEGTFSPEGLLTRAQLITILWRAEGEPAASGAVPYADVEAGAWYAQAVGWALEKKLIRSEAGASLEPNAPLTRAETAALLWNWAKSGGLDVSVGEDTNILSYTDFTEIPEGAAPALQWAVGAGVMEGMGDGTLAPQGSLTRAQAAAVLMRYDAFERAGHPLSLWAEGSEARSALEDYVRAVTDEGSPDYIPVEDRIAVFDLDGTLFCETDPNYFDYTLLAYRVLDDPDYRDRASAFEREVAEKIVEQNRSGASFSGLEVDHGRAVASAFAGMTLAEFNDYIQRFKKFPMPSYQGMTRGEGFYKPMVQVVEYLQANEFTVYVVSGTDRLIVRGILDGSILNIPKRQIIGSDETIVSSGQGAADGLDYVFAEGDELILGGDFLIKNLKMNKVSVIQQEIGQQPVLSFGNSTGDSSMAEFVTSRNPYRSLAFMLCCDDTQRENGNEAKARKMYDLCEEFDWVPVSMKNDWTTIYGGSVSYLGSAIDKAA